MRSWKAVLGAVMIAALSLGVGVKQVSADTITASFFSAQWVVPGSTIEVTYRISFDATNSAMPSGSTFANSSFFTIYNFQGLQGTPTFSSGVDGQTAPGDWVLTVQNIGVDAPLTAPLDNPALPNITARYNSGATIVSTGVLGYVSAVTNVLTSAVKPGHFTSQDYHTGNNAFQSHIHALQVPDSGGDIPIPIPLPLAAWGGLGLFGLLGLMKARQRR
jgi:hypothetical protein